MQYPDHLQKVIEVLRRLPGVGTKSAERFAFHMLGWEPEIIAETAATIEAIPHKLQHCATCGCLTDGDHCNFCTATNRDSSVICLVASARDVFSVETTGEFRGLYHVLGGTISPIEGRGPEHLAIAELKNRIQAGEIKELVIALDSTLEGDATSLYLQRELQSTGIRLTRLAFGLPMGSALDYVDGGTLARAFSGRSMVN